MILRKRSLSLGQAMYVHVVSIFHFQPLKSYKNGPASFFSEYAFVQSLFVA